MKTLTTTVETEHGISYIRLDTAVIGYYAPTPAGGWHGSAYGTYPNYTTGHQEPTEPAIRHWIETTWKDAHA